MKIGPKLAFVLGIVMGACGSVHAQNIKVTPLGQRTGEFCAQDRAIIFEDPTGVRVLYDPGNTVAGAADARLGAVDVILISHAHGDHLGNAKLNQDPNATNASCSSAATMPQPSSNTADIAAGKHSAVMAGGPLASVIGRLIAAVAGSATPGCPASGPTNEMTVPRAAACTAGLGLGAKRSVRNVAATQGVQVTAVTAEHPNELSTGFLADPERSELAANNLNAYVGLANGFVVTFTNGLSVYLSGDTGLTSDMGTIVHDYMAACCKLASGLASAFAIELYRNSDARKHNRDTAAAIPHQLGKTRCLRAVDGDSALRRRFVGVRRNRRVGTNELRNRERSLLGTRREDVADVDHCKAGGV